MNTITTDELRRCVTGAYALGRPTMAHAFERAAQRIEDLERQVNDLEFDLEAAREARQ